MREFSPSIITNDSVLSSTLLNPALQINLVSELIDVLNLSWILSAMASTNMLIGDFETDTLVTKYSAGESNLHSQMAVRIAAISPWR